MAMRAIRRRGALLLFSAFILANGAVSVRASPSEVDVNLRIRLPKPGPHRHMPPAVLWLSPLPGTPSRPFLAGGRYTLAQKNRTFVPHLIVVPVVSEVFFPNLDPFFHNVFSLFNGKRFDLGLYEAGATKQVTFAHEGVSYIF